MWPSDSSNAYGTACRRPSMPRSPSRRAICCERPRSQRLAGSCPHRSPRQGASRSPWHGFACLRVLAPAATRRCFGSCPRWNRRATPASSTSRTTTAGRSNSTSEPSGRGGPGYRPRCGTPPRASRTPTPSSRQPGRPHTPCWPRLRVARASTSFRTSSHRSIRPGVRP